MVKLVKTVRQNDFEWEPEPFTGTSPDDCQNKAVPSSLTSLVAIM